MHASPVMKLALVAMGGALVAAVGCAHGRAADDGYGTTTLTSARAPLNDAGAAEILRAGLEGLEATLRIASSRAALPRVRAFAAASNAEYASALRDAGASFARAGVTPEMSPASELMRGQIRMNERDLASRQSSDLDRAYVDDEIALASKLVDDIDDDLLQATTSVALRDELLRARSRLAARVDAAKQIHAWLLAQP